MKADNIAFIKMGYPGESQIKQNFSSIENLQIGKTIHCNNHKSEQFRLNSILLSYSFKPQARYKPQTVRLKSNV